VTSLTDRRQGPRGEGPGGFEDSVIKIDRFAKVVKGGRRFSFGALVVIGDRSTHVGLGYGKANEVPQAVDKAVATAHKSILTVCLKGNTIPHQVRGKCGASEVVLLPASEGTGVIAGKALRPLLQLAGIKDVLTKAYGSTSPVNLLKAGVDALQQLRSAESIQSLRGVNLE
jgi:small subunit ribosomal protein S5